MEKVIPFQQRLDNALFEYGEGVSFDLDDIPTYLVDTFAVKLFSGTVLSGDKGKQDDILNRINSMLTVQDQLDLEIITPAFLVEQYDNAEGLEDFTVIREQNNR